MVRLLGETAALGGGHAEKKRHLMDGLCRILGVDAWVWALGQRVDPNVSQPDFSALHGGFSDARFAQVNVALENPIMGEIENHFFGLIEQTGQQVTMTRAEADPEGLALDSEIAATWQAVDVGSIIMSGFPVERGSISYIGFYRRFGDSDFSEREKQICLLYTSPSPRDQRGSRMPSSA